MSANSFFIFPMVVFWSDFCCFVVNETTARGSGCLALKATPRCHKTEQCVTARRRLTNGGLVRFSTAAPIRGDATGQRREVMTVRPTRWWFTAIPITGRFYIMFAVLLLCVGAVVFGALRTTQLRSEAGAELARAAAVQRSLDRALTIHASLTAQLQQPAGDNSSQNLLTALRAQLEATWALQGTAEIGAITDSLRTPATQFFHAV